MLLRLVNILFITILFLVCPDSALAAARYPEVTFAYSQIFNSTCADMTKQPIETAAIKELENRLDSFREHWRKEAPRLFGTTVKLTNAPFQFRETKAALSLCVGFPSISLPLTINMRSYLSSVRGDKAAPMTRFSVTVFHEVLHRYVNDRIEKLPGKTTPLLRKYGNEPQAVQNHLHVMAIMQAVYAKLGREKDLDEDTGTEQTVRRSAAAINRARELIEKEGAGAFISELRKSR